MTNCVSIALARADRGSDLSENPNRKTKLDGPVFGDVGFCIMSGAVWIVRFEFKNAFSVSL